MRGQISFDFMIVLAFTLILLQSLIVFSDNFLLNQERINIRLQEKQIIQDIQKVALYAGIFEGQMLASEDSYQINHYIPKIYLSGSAGSAVSVPIECDITIDATSIAITVNETHFPNLGTEIISQSIDISEMDVPSSAFGDYDCGGTLTLTYP